MCERNQGQLPRELINLEPLMTELKGLSQPSIYSGTLAENTSNTSEIHHIHQGEWGGVINTPERYLATFGAGECFIVAIYDTINKRGALSHLDALSNPELTADLMRNFVSHCDRIVMLGGSQNASSDMAKFYGKVKEWQRDVLIADVIVGPVLQGTVCSLALDLETGDLLNFKSGYVATSRVAAMRLDISTRAQRIESTGQIPAARPCFPN